MLKLFGLTYDIFVVYLYLKFNVVTQNFFLRILLNVKISLSEINDLDLLNKLVFTC